MTSIKFSFKCETFHRAYVKQRNRELERDLVLAQTKLRYLMEHVDSFIVPTPPEASFLSEKDKLELKEDIANTYDTRIDELVAHEQKKTPHSPPDQIREEITNGMVYYMFFYVIQLQADIDPSLPR